MAIGAFRVRPLRRGLKVPSLAVLATILGNGVVGGIAVRGDLHPTLVQSHFILAMLSIGFGLVAIHRSAPEPVGRREDVGVTPTVAALFAALGVLVAAALITGTVVTGAGPHAGDETARRYGFDISTVAEIHSITVWVAVAVFLVLVVTMRRTPGLFEEFAGKISTWMFLAVLQGGIGYVQYFNDIPAVLVAAHVAGATALWLATVWLILAGWEPIAGDRRGVHAPETHHALGESLPVGNIP
jgi:cytochrome c oxidase assembly protein subunit 15